MKKSWKIISLQAVWYEGEDSPMAKTTVLQLWTTLIPLKSAGCHQAYSCNRTYKSWNNVENYEKQLGELFNYFTTLLFKLCPGYDYVRKSVCLWSWT